MKKFYSFLALGLIAVGANAQDLNQARYSYFHEKWQREHSEALALARLSGIPIRGETKAGRTYELARFEHGRPLYFITDNAESATLIKAPNIYPGGSTGFSLTGSGIKFGEWDAGSVRATHQEFAGGRVTVKDAVSTHYHSTHVAGTIMASGVQADAKGMSYQGTLDSYDWNNDEAELEAANVPITNHSYGFITGWDGNYWYGDPKVSKVQDYYFGFYDSQAHDMDQIAVDKVNMLICRSAGNERNDGPGGGTTYYYDEDIDDWAVMDFTPNNDGNGTGYDTVAHAAVAKNVLSVGAVDKNGNMSSFSSWGPTDDGRVKPDIVADGVDVYSTYNGTDTAYNTISGTSMATPSVVGGLGLVLQKWNQIFPSTPMRSNMLKALAIETAVEMGASDGPDYIYGWGQLDVQAATTLLNQRGANVAPSKLYNTTATSGQTKELTFTSTGGPLKVTACWIDTPGTVTAAAVNNRTPKLVEDVDIRVQKVGGSTYAPWVLNPASPAAAATRADNVRDNVEQVYLPAATAGTYKLILTRKGTSGSTSVAISTSGLTFSAPALSSFSLPAEVVGGNAVTGTATLSGNAFGNETITMTSDSTHVHVPASISPAQYATSANANITTDVIVLAETVTVSAKLGSTTKMDSILVKPAVIQIINTVITPANVVGGNPASETVTLNGPAPAGFVVTVRDNDSRTSVPASVTVPTGASTVTFPITSQGTAVQFTSEIRVSHLKQMFKRYLVVYAPALSTFSISPTSVTGGTNATGDITLNGKAFAAGIYVNVSSDGAEAIVPATVGFGQNVQEKTFVIKTKVVTARVTRTITVSYLGVTRTKSLVINK